MSMARRTSIAIIGGGIGGLTAAASLLHAGFDAHVYEQAKALGEVGAGINKRSKLLLAHRTIPFIAAIYIAR
jgi:2-polyprenyl-6-methoxyphenol hydroxylase-like FAD-dependent oxidoreductase